MIARGERVAGVGRQAETEEQDGDRVRGRLLSKIESCFTNTCSPDCDVAAGHRIPWLSG